MIKKFKMNLLGIQAGFVTGLLVSTTQAQAANATFSDIGENIIDSVAELPGLLTGITYLMGLLMGALGILKIKDHVENPTQTHLKDGAVRMAAGGALFALPIVYEAMQNTIGTTTNFVQAAELHRVELRVK